MATKIKIGDLRRCIEIQSATLVSDGMGGQTETWAKWKSKHAKIEPMSAKQIAFMGSLEHRVTHKIVIRYDADVTSDMRISYDGRIFHIHSYRNLNEEKRFLEILAEEGARS